MLTMFIFGVVVGVFLIIAMQHHIHRKHPEDLVKEAVAILARRWADSAAKGLGYDPETYAESSRVMAKREIAGWLGFAKPLPIRDTPTPDLDDPEKRGLEV